MYVHEFTNQERHVAAAEKEQFDAQEEIIAESQFWGLLFTF